MEVGCPLWVKDDAKDSELAWVAGVLASKEGPELTGDGSTRLGVDIVDPLAAGRARRALVVRAAAADSADAAGGLETDELKLRNEEGKDDVADLITLPHLHEPAILRALEVRYARGRIYTFTGPILLAVNPFQRLPALYSHDVLEQFYSRGLLAAQGVEVAAAGPHVFAIADAAYRDMVTRLPRHGHGAGGDAAGAASQAVLISGESGAGKTESTKIVLRWGARASPSSGAAAGVQS